VIRPATLTVELAPAHGLAAGASSLVLERVYPTRWISPRLSRAGDRIELPLDGFETAVYELYPIVEAAEPLFAGVVFDVVSETKRERIIRYYDASPNAILLNEHAVRSVTYGRKSVRAGSLAFTEDSPEEPAADFAVVPWKGNEAGAQVRCTLSPSVTGAVLAVLLSPAADCAAKERPMLAVELNGASVKAGAEPQEGKSQWWTVPLPGGRCEATLRVTPCAGDRAYTGTVQVWLVASQRCPSHELSLELAKPPRSRVLPPQAWPAGTTRRTQYLGETNIMAK
jgi:hypothetical protein